MAYQFDFVPVLANSDLLLRGALFTLELTAIGAILGVALGTVGAVVRAWKIQPFSWIFGVYVELIRNTPFLVQLFFIFFGLPSLGLKITEWQAAVLAMVINLGAYSTEIIRAGIQAIPRGQLAYVLTRMEELSEEYGLRVANVFHAGDGNLHPLILFDANVPGELDNAEKFGADILRLCVEVGGVLTGEHGVGIEKRDLMGEMFTEDDMKHQQRLKCAFDLGHLLNPGKVYHILNRCP